MQKQKTIAKWLAIIVLCSVAVGSYLLYDALYVEKNNSQATADNNTSDNLPDIPNNGGEVHIPYYTTLPRQSEVIDGISVTHFGGEGDDKLQEVINYSGKRFAFFQSESVEFDVREKGLHVAVIGEEVEKVTYLGSNRYVDGKMCGNGVVILTKNNDFGTLNLIGKTGDKQAEIQLPYFEDGMLYISEGELVLFIISDGYLKCYKILENMTLQNSPFLIGAKGNVISEVFAAPQGYVIVTSKNDSVSILTYSHNTGFKLMFSRDKLLFKQIITAGSAVTCNYVLYGISENSPLLLSFDTSFQVTALRAIEGASDGVIFPCGDGLNFVGNGVTASFCKHLDEISFSHTQTSFERVAAFTPTKNGFLVVFKTETSYRISLIYDEIFMSKSLDISGDVIGIKTTETGFSILVDSPSALGYFRGNFGGYDPYILDFDLSYFE